MQPQASANGYGCAPTKLYLQTLKFECHVVFTCYAILSFLLPTVEKCEKTLLAHGRTKTGGRSDLIGRSQIVNSWPLGFITLFLFNLDLSQHPFSPTKRKWPCICWRVHISFSCPLNKFFQPVGFSIDELNTSLTHARRICPVHPECGVGPSLLFPRLPSSPPSILSRRF